VQESQGKAARWWTTAIRSGGDMKHLEHEAVEVRAALLLDRRAHKEDVHHEGLAAPDAAVHV
jgi:hypothetical protein